jgi:hypothetical protein
MTEKIVEEVTLAREGQKIFVIPNPTFCVESNNAC